MSLHFFAIPALQAQAAQDEFNAFCAAHRVVAAQWQCDAASGQTSCGRRAPTHDPRAAVAASIATARTP